MSKCSELRNWKIKPTAFYLSLFQIEETRSSLQWCIWIPSFPCHQLTHSNHTLPGAPQFSCAPYWQLWWLDWRNGHWFWVLLFPQEWWIQHPSHLGISLLPSDTKTKDNVWVPLVLLFPEWAHPRLTAPVIFYLFQTRKRKKSSKLKARSIFYINHVSRNMDDSVL